MQSWNLREIETPGGSISPVVLDSDDAARVVLIGLDPGQELGEHQVKEHALVLVVDGTVRVEAGGEAGARGQRLHRAQDHAQQGRAVERWLAGNLEGCDLHLRARRAALGFDRRRRADPALPRAVARPWPRAMHRAGREATTKA